MHVSWNVVKWSLLWPWLHGNWISILICNRVYRISTVSSCIRSDISLSVIFGRSVVFLWYSGFLLAIWSITIWHNFFVPEHSFFDMGVPLESNTRQTIRIIVNECHWECHARDTNNSFHAPLLGVVVGNPLRYTMAQSKCPYKSSYEMSQQKHSHVAVTVI